ncbi:MAG: DEAD/DEAH box helicase family protein [Bacteroidia bacterium]|nr:DEAD/DEAH box helicase family protein [Bacteroidia bacterium]
MAYWDWNYYPSNLRNKNKLKPSERKKFGQTFWGKEWLNSLKGIDYSNRLPRGSAYANNGSVTSHETKGNRIVAKVQGSFPKPYDVFIEVPEFSKTEKEKIAEILFSNPAWIAELLNKQLPKDLLAEAKKNNINIFPSKWNDFKMRCSCPDSAVPCKHLAAVIYILSSEIDLNPMLVLNLHNLDIAEELKKKKLDVTKDINEKIPILFDGIKFDKKKVFPVMPEIHEKSFEVCEYSHFPDTGLTLLNLLSDETPFHNKNAKTELISFFNAALRTDKRLIYYSDTISSKLLQTCIDVRIVVPESIENTEVHLIFEKETKRVSLPDFAAFMHTTDVSDTKNWIYLLQTIHEFVNFSVRLIHTGNTTPKIVTHNNQNRLIWTPLIQDHTIEKVVSFFSEIMPSQLFIVESANKKETGILREADIALFASFFITSIIQYIKSKDFKFDKKNELNNLFCGNNSKFLNDASTINSIHIWLKKLHVSKSRFKPILKVDDHYPEFRMSLLVDDSEQSNEPPIAIKEFSENKKYQTEKMGVIKNLMLLSGHFTGLSRLINNTQTKYVSYRDNDFTSLLFGVIPCLKLLGVKVLLPKGLAMIATPKLSMAVKSKGGEKPRSFMSLFDMLAFEWQIAIGDSLMEPKEFFKLLSNYTGLIKIKDKYIMLGSDEIERLKKNLEKRITPDFNETIRAILSENYEGAHVGIDPEIINLLKKLTGSQKEKLPNHLNAQLRPYQIRGYEWLCKNSRLGVGSILADDMGLGKTLQALTFLLKLKETGQLEKKKCLIIAPTTILNNWGREIEKFTPGLTYFIYHGLKRDDKELQNYDIVFTSYGVLRRDVAIFEKKEWQALIIDEAQNIKNSEAQQTKALKKIKASVRIALSGTPVENRLGEYWSIMDFINKGLLGNRSFFSKNFANPIQLEHDQEKIDVFRKVTAPFIMRRMKNDKSIISDLPDKIENNKISALTKAQAALYTSVVNECMEQIESSDGIARKGMVLKMMTSLKQIGNHPAQYLKNNKCNPADSGKLELLFDLLEPILDNGEKVLLFTQYKEMGDILQKALTDKFGITPLFLHGSLNRKQRDEMVNGFQHFKHNHVFILSLKAGGTGLNLTAASNVIHYDLWWNPAVESQATDRAYRIGQNKNVMVYRLINKGTLEERIDEMINSKKKLAEMTVATGENWLGDLSNQELKNLVSLSQWQ